MDELLNAKEAIRQIAINEGVSELHVRKQIQLAMQAGLCNPDPVIQARWRKIPCRGNTPTPEELIAYLATHINGGIDLF